MAVQVLEPATRACKTARPKLRVKENALISQSIWSSHLTPEATEN